MFRLRLKVYGAVITKKLNVIKQNEFFKIKIEIFFENHPSTRRIKSKRIYLAPFNGALKQNSDEYNSAEKKFMGAEN